MKMEQKERNRHINIEASRRVSDVLRSFMDFSSSALDVIWQCRAAFSHSLPPLPLCPLRSLDGHCTPLYTLVGDHIWLQSAPGTPAMACKRHLHQPLMAFEGAWLPTTRDSWIAPERGKAGRLGGWMGGRCGGGSGAPSCPAVKLCCISPAALWACLESRSSARLIPLLLWSISV